MKKRSTLRLLAHSFSYLGPDAGKYMLGVVLSCCEFALLFAVPYVNQALIDMVVGLREGNILLTVLLMLALFLVLVPPVVIGTYLRSTTAELAVARLRKDLFHHIARLPYSTLTQYKTGDYITRLSDDANRSGLLIGGFSVIQLLRFAVVFPITFMLLLVNDWHIALAGVLYGSINMALSLYLNPRAKAQEAVAKAEIADSASFLIEALRAIPVVRVFILHKELEKRYGNICHIIKEKRMKYQNIIGLTYGTVDFFAQSAQAVGFIIGVLLSAGKGSLGQVVFNASLMGMMGDAIYRLSTFLLLSQPGLVAMERIQQLLELPLEDLENGSQEVNTESKIVVEFRDVCFSYDGEHNIIDHLNLTLHQGEQLAIVGGSGGGKSTIVKLIEGFYHPDSGEIRYFDSNHLSLSRIRELFAYVPQECTLFDGSIGENIGLGQQRASLEEIAEAAKQADIHEYIVGLDQGYDSQTGERGGQLSGGQRQRIAIARGILKKAPVLLLDEATAALDSETEKEVQACLDQLSAQTTTLTVAHRLSTIRNAHRILVIEKGKIVEEGKFDQLLTLGGRFTELYESQQQIETSEACI